MNDGEKCRKWGSLGRLGGTEGYGQCHHSIERIRLPIRMHASILYRFRDIAGYLSKVADFDPTHLHLAPPYGVTRSNFAEIFGFRKLESLDYRVVLFV